MNILQELLPAAQLAAAEQALLQTFQTTEVPEATLLAGGLSAAAVYKIRVREQYYVLKLNPATGQPGAGLPLSCMEIAAAAGIAPPVLHRDDLQGITITGFVQTSPLRTAFPSAAALLPQLAAIIRSVHGLPLFPGQHQLLATVEAPVNAFLASGMLTGPVFDEAFRYFDLIRQHYPWQDTDLVSSHNDLNPQNILFGNNRIWVIDWDAAGRNDRYVDLAIAANFYLGDDQHELLFLEAYFGSSPDDYQLARFFIMRQVCRLVYATMMFRLAAQSKSAGHQHPSDLEGISLAAVKQQLGSGQLQLTGYTGQLMFGKALLLEAVKDMRTARFNISVRLLREH